MELIWKAKRIALIVAEEWKQCGLDTNFKKGKQCLLQMNSISLNRKFQ